MCSNVSKCVNVHWNVQKYVKLRYKFKPKRDPKHSYISA